MILKQKGFTKIEQLSVISLVVVVLVITFIFVQKINKNSRDAQRLSDINHLKTTLEIKSISDNFYPPSPPPESPDWADSCKNPNGYILGLTAEGHNVNLPADPINSEEKCYRYRGANNEFKIAVFMETKANKENYADRDGGTKEEWFEIFTSGARNWSW